ncbi:MAG: hypothetical protein A2365_01090 [Candidatus Nealsonbacteria bacterium RIFOXYB1_FULL_40_15]|uniref:Resolvase HTH domain-containing protein n=1 Tax=Candidatus Nealsonbacteria bacterium RIFOXYB1_FULL_40_15 TaxID=1801677 RepID=A0A1G2EM82_9BACT|nr:MAG: hypothetical protein A2365_01090 [Candidatus Nealsonbacteria bacterium RIFOXYB1_FULL_40_15]OGZ28309.1 MAG: hypothetical protein A2562_01580 [Candidatus Nealsonbacteria bacterium RIFOXYD1_FULL_39_11]
MKFHQEDIVDKARKLRKEGFSATEIGKRFNLRNSTILRWCYDIPSINPNHIYLGKLRTRAKNKNFKLIEDIDINKLVARLLTSIIYWCEGSKYPSSNFISFTNSDPELVKTFLKLFRLGFQPIEDKLRVRLQLHSTHNEEEVNSYWSELLKIPASQFYKPTITNPTKNMKRRGYMGTCDIRYNNVYLLHEITGIYEGFSKKLNC